MIIVLILCLLYEVFKSPQPLSHPIFRIFNIEPDDPSWDYHLDNVVKAHGKHILISPIQPIHLYNNEWWSKYQPLSYIIQDDMKKKLTHLCNKARKRNIKVIVDVVWNHTSITIYNEKTKYRYNQHIPNPAVETIENKTYEWFSDGLPDLNTKLLEIKKEGRKAVEIMRKCGASGFRMDAANYIDEEFFDYVYENSPMDELHLYEVWVENIDSYEVWKLNRIKHDKCEVVFYDLSSYFYLKENININKKQPCLPVIPSEISINAILNHDLVLHFNKDDSELLYMYFLISLFTGNDKYFYYSIFTSEESSSILIYSLLFNWNNYFNNITPILKIKQHAPKVLGTIDFFKYDYHDSTQSPLFVGSIGKNYKMLINIKHNLASSVDSITCKQLFGETSDKLTLINLLNNKKLPTNRITSDYISVPDFSYSLIYNKRTLPEKINIIMFWYQGYDEMPDWCKKSLRTWSNYENCKVHFFDRQRLSTVLSKEELTHVKKIEDKIKKPYMYATVCDYIRWVLLLKYKGGVYIDCDVYPSSTSMYLLNCVNQYNYLILGKEPSGFINNAIIIAPPETCPMITIIIDLLVKNIYEKDISTNDITDYKYMYDSSNPYFNWTINHTGPSFIKGVMDTHFKDNENILLLDSIWLYSTYYNTDKKIDRNCGNNIGLIQHCYASSWVKT